MRLNINLASQPYEAARLYVQRMTALIAVLGVIAVGLLGYVLYQWRNSRDINRQLSVIQSQIEMLDNEEGQARAILNKPSNRVIADQSDFLNQLFARKALSWTRIFTEMEKIVPAGLHVVSMKPEYTKTNDLILHVVVATDSRERAVEMVRNMEKSTHLRQPQVDAEVVTTGSGDQSAGGGNIQFDIAAVYLPGVAESDAPESTPAPGGKAPAGSAPSSTERKNTSPVPLAPAKIAPRTKTSAGSVPAYPASAPVNSAPVERAFGPPVNRSMPNNPGTVTSGSSNVVLPRSAVTSANPNYIRPGSFAPAVNPDGSTNTGSQNTLGRPGSNAHLRGQ